MVYGLLPVIEVITWLYSHITVPALMLYAWLPVVVVFGVKYWYDNRRVVVLDIGDIAYGESTFGVVVVMILVDGVWRPALPADIPYLPSWDR